MWCEYFVEVNIDFRRFGLPQVSVCTEFVDTVNRPKLSIADVWEVMLELEQFWREARDAKKYNGLVDYATAKLERKKEKSSMQRD